MGFGLFYLPAAVPGRSAQQQYAAIIDEACAADELGFDAIWFSEHHFDAYGGIVPSPVVLGAALAMRTRRIRIGTAAALLPLHNCLRLAEEYAMLDVLSGGRIELGIGRGFMPHEFRALGIGLDARQERFDEGLEVLLRAWTQERFSYDGRLYQLTDVTITPRPLQRPHPPIWLAASLNPRSFEIAGQRGFNLMINPYTRTPEEVRNGLHWYRRALAQAGHDPAQRRILAHFHLYVAPTEQQARVEPREELMYYLRVQDQAIGKGDQNGQGAEEALTYDDMYPDRVLFGTPERVASQICAWMEVGVTDFCFATQFGTMSPERSLASLRLFATEVMPRFR
jgi:natural product biosynthesis luciferase-like monooxygenase protein